MACFGPIFRGVGIHVYAVELKIRPKIALFELKIRPKFSFFFCFCFSKIFFFLQGEWDFSKKIKEKKEKKNYFLRWKSVQLCCATYLDGFSTQPWTDFQLNNFVNFGPFFLLKKCRDHYFYSVFSQKMKFLSPPQKIKEHYLWTQLR